MTEKEYFRHVHDLVSDASNNYFVDSNFILSYELHELRTEIQSFHKDFIDQTDKITDQLMWLRSK